MALGYGEGGEQTAALGRAVIGGLLFATIATLMILPHVFAVVLGKSKAVSPSLHPMDKDSKHYDPTGGADTHVAHHGGEHAPHTGEELAQHPGDTAHPAHGESEHPSIGELPPHNPDGGAPPPH
jgi:hypothetical protein